MITVSVQRPVRPARKSVIGFSPYFLLAFLAALPFIPLVISPHWGTFSDAVQIVQNNRIFWQNPASHLDLVNGFWRPGFHLPDLLLWKVSAENPLGYYLFRASLFATIVCLTYSISYLVTNSRPVSFVVALYWLLASSTYEVIYTLDKGELYVTLVLSTLLFLFLRGERKGLGRSSLVLAILASTWSMFTKETAQIWIVFSLFALGNLIWRRRNNLDVSRKQTLNAAIFSGIGLLSWALFKAYFVITGGTRASSYVHLNFSFDYLISQLAGYSEMIPDFGILLLFGIGSAICFGNSASRPLSIYARPMAGAVVVGSILILAFQYRVAYVWFPLYTFVFPLVALGVIELLALGKHLGRFMSILIYTLACSYCLVLPTRVVQAQIQFQLDELTQDVSRQLAKLVKENNARGKERLRIAFPFVSPNSIEMGERLEFYTLDRMHPGYVEQDADHDSAQPCSFYNFLAYDVDTPPDVLLYKPAGANRSDLTFSVQTDDDHIGLHLFSYWSTAGTAFHWTRSDFTEGTLVLVPYGTLPNSVATYRGAGLYLMPWQEALRFIPQAEMVSVFNVHRNILLNPRRRRTLGWQLVKVKHLLPLSWNIDTGGWLHDPCKLDFGSTISGKVVRILTQELHPQRISIKYDDKIQVIEAKPARDGFEYWIPLPSVGEHHRARIELRSADSAWSALAHVRLMRVARVEVR